jgi:hypothetical protein
MGWFDSFVNSKLDKSFVNDAEKLLNVCRSYGPVERADLKVCTALALKFLLLDSDTDQSKCIHFILDAMDTGRNLTGREIALASAYNIRLGKLQKQAYESSSPVNNLIASGIPVWIISIKALSRVVVLPYAREIWSILQNGDSLWCYDKFELLEQWLQGHPLGENVRSGSYMSTPRIFVPQ